MEILSNIAPLPFYTDLSQQHHRKFYSFGQIYPLMVSGSYLLPFQFIVNCSSPSISKDFSGDFSNDFSLAHVSGNTETKDSTLLQIHNIILHALNLNTSDDITNNMQTGLSVSQLEDNLVLVKYKGFLPIFSLTKEGSYYIEIKTNLGSLYSDVFTSSHDLSSCILLTYTNSYNLNLPKGHIDFDDNFKFECYIDTVIGKPEYTFEEEVTTRMGYPFIESQISKKIYKFTGLAPEYLCDALRIVRLCNNKRIISNQNVYDLISFSINPKWEEQGDLAVIDCEFETDTIIQNIGNLL